MKRNGNLWDEIVSFKNLVKAAKNAWRGKKDKARVSSFYFHFETELFELQQELMEGQYFPRPYKMFEIRDPKVRTICSSDFRDRVVHHAICRVIEPILEKNFIYDSYACRPKKGAHIALNRCQKFVQKYDYFLKCDIKKYFESIDHSILKTILEKIFKDSLLLTLMNQIIDHIVPGYPKGKGIPIGALTSQHFANLYLSELDHFLKDRQGIQGYLRYMDDFICFGENAAILHEKLILIRAFLWENLRLELKEKVTKIAPVNEGVPFLGFMVFPDLIRVQRPNLVRIRRKIKQSENDFLKGKISVEALVQSNSSRINHISQADTLTLRKKEFTDMMASA